MPIISESVEKVKGWVSDNRADLFTALTIFLIGIASFGLGRLSVVLPRKEPIFLEETPILADDQISASSQTPPASGLSHAVKLKNGLFVASKSGSVYYAVWCSGVSRIREENKVWFQTKEEAKVKGYRPAKNCPGL